MEEGSAAAKSVSSTAALTWALKFYNDIDDALLKAGCNGHNKGLMSKDYFDYYLHNGLGLWLEIETLIVRLI